MCVLMIVEKNRPSDLMLERAQERNPDGIGLAWREPAADGKGNEVVWKKGLDLVEATELCATIPLPYAIHFRRASSGGDDKKFTHPFPICSTVPTYLEGRYKGYVLFHNGDWKEWKDDVKQAALSSGEHLPVGQMNDTRAIAWLCHVYGNGFMDLLEKQRGLAFGPEAGQMDVFIGPGWVKVEDIWCSNDIFWTQAKQKYVAPAVDHVRPSYTMYPDRVCKYGTCASHYLDSDGHCYDHLHGLAALSGKPQAGFGGSQANTTPFPPVLAEGVALTLEVAEQLHKELHPNGVRKLSKNMLKAVRVAHENLKSKNPKTAAKAARALAFVQSRLSGNGQPALTAKVH